MFTPDLYRETDLPTLHDLIEAYPFAIMISTRDGAVSPSHLPFVLDRTAGPNGTLYAHMSRANPHGSLIGAGTPALVIFQGPHAYISPNWYGPGDAVPTWDYATVHAHGIATVVEDDDAVRHHLETLIARFEGDGPDAWSMAGQKDSYLDGMQRGIIAFELPIERLEGKFKLSQNRPDSDRKNVADQLLKSARGSDRELADLMHARED